MTRRGPQHHQTPRVSRQAGFSVIGVIVMLALVVTLATGIAASYSNNLDAAVAVKTRERERHMRQFLANVVGCFRTIDNAPAGCAGSEIQVHTRRHGDAPLINVPFSEFSDGLRLRGICGPDSSFTVQYARRNGPWKDLKSYPPNCGETYR